MESRNYYHNKYEAWTFTNYKFVHNINDKTNNLIL